MSHDDGTPWTPADGPQPATPPQQPYAAPQQPCAVPQPTPPQSGAQQPGHPPAPTYPGTGAPGAPGALYPGPVGGGQADIDGVSIAALVTGILGLAVVPLALGIVGLRRTKRNGTGGRGFAVAGTILGAIGTIGWIVTAIVIAVVLHNHSTQVAELRTDCAGGDMAACDSLYRTAWSGTAEKEFGRTCGGLADGTGWCDSTGGTVRTYGDDTTLDALWDSCAAGDMTDCDSLYSTSPQDSDYESFGITCGDRVYFSWSCEDEY
ncbi:MAG TPA: DUF4190 domain-containing protein [Cellulomonas sp.]